MTPALDRAGDLARELAGHGVEGVDVALVLGSGLGAFAAELEEPLELSDEDLEHLPGSAVPGHAGKLVLGRLGGARVAVQQGRVHLYEGWSPLEVTRTVRALAELGAHTLVLTNAAGCLEASWPLPTLMSIRDHVNLQGRPPLASGRGAFGSIYDRELGEKLACQAAELGIELASGVYAGLLGPAYETPAEIRMLAKFGVAAVGMSTVAEAAAARAAGLRVLGISCLTNPAAGLTAEPLAHAEVVTAARQVAADLVRLLSALLPELSAGR